VATLIATGTKNGGRPGWLPKLREDQRTAKAEIAVVVTQALPKNVEIFDLTDGVWISIMKLNTHQITVKIA
jgi:hypothetical protein